MATFKRVSVPSRAAPDDGPIPVEALDGTVPPAEWARWSEAQRTTWRALRARIFAASVGGPFDPRHALTLPADRLALWRERRRAWLHALVGDDPRIGGASWRR